MSQGGTKKGFVRDETNFWGHNSFSFANQHTLIYQPQQINDFVIDYY